MRPDIGREYFEGDLNKIKRTIINAYRDHVRENPCVNDTMDSTKIEVPDVDVINEFIRSSSEMTNVMSEKIKQTVEAGDVLADDLTKVAMQTENRRFMRYLHDAGYDIFGDTYENYFAAPQGMRTFIRTLLPKTITLTTGKKFIERLLDDEHTAELLDQSTIKLYLDMCVYNYEYENFKKYYGRYVGSMSDFMIAPEEVCNYTTSGRRFATTQVVMSPHHVHGGDVIRNGDDDSMTSSICSYVHVVPRTDSFIKRLFNVLRRRR